MPFICTGAPPEKSIPAEEPPPACHPKNHNFVGFWEKAGTCKSNRNNNEGVRNLYFDTLRKEDTEEIILSRNNFIFSSNMRVA